MAFDLISREDARSKGLKRFCTGTPCRRGHICERYVADYSCIGCQQLPERKAKIKEYDQANREQRKEYMREWKEQNRGRVNELGCIWAKRNPEKHAARSRLRRARARGAEGNHTVEEIHDLFKRQKMKCASCRTSIRDGYEVDHIVSLSKGGSNFIRNIQLLCVPCNRRKNAKDPLDWARQNGRLL